MVALARLRAFSQRDTQVVFRPAAPVVPPPLPPAVGEALERFFEGSGSHQAVQRLELQLCRALELDRVLCVWIDWANRTTWTPEGMVSARLEDVTIEAAGTGHRVVLGNALIEPLGRAPACAVIAFKGPPERLFVPYALRTISRVCTRLAPAIDRLGP